MSLRSVDSNATSLVEKVRNMAIKREQQAAKAASQAVAQELSATAKSYRELADALAKAPDNLLEKEQRPFSGKIG